MATLTYGSAQRGGAARSQRLVAFATIAGLHALVLAVIVSGFGRIAVQVLSGDITARIIDPPKDIIDPPPPPPPTLRQIDVDAGPPPDVPIETEGGGETAISVPLAVPQPVAPVAVASPAPLPIRLVGKHRLPNTDDYYPASEIRNGVQGASIVSVCVDENGKRSNEPSVVESSGTARLDQGAMHVLRDGRYALEMQGDRYVPNCYQFRIIFKVDDR